MDYQQYIKHKFYSLIKYGLEHKQHVEQNNMSHPYKLRKFQKQNRLMQLRRQELELNNMDYLLYIEHMFYKMSKYDLKHKQHVVQNNMSHQYKLHRFQMQHQLL
jgi:hypothetical protein